MMIFGVFNYFRWTWRLCKLEIIAKKLFSWLPELSQELIVAFPSFDLLITSSKRTMRWLQVESLKPFTSWSHFLSIYFQHSVLTTLSNKNVNTFHLFSLRSVHGITWTDREGLKPDRTEYFKGSNPGADTRRTFNLAGLLIFTDARISQYPDTGIDLLHRLLYKS